MRRLHILLLILLALSSLIGIYFSPEILAYLAKGEAENTGNKISQTEICSDQDTDITVLEDHTHVRNTGSSTLRKSNLVWENSTGKYSENLGSLNPTSVQRVHTGSVAEAKVVIEECEEPLAMYPEG